jgi:hypothetical protein
MKTITQKLHAQAYVRLINEAFRHEYNAVNARKAGDTRTAKCEQRQAKKYRRQAVAALTAPASGY